MRLSVLAALPAALALIACTEPSAPDAADAPPTSETAVLVPAPAETQADPALDSAVATALGDAADSTRTVTRIVGEGSGRVALVYLVGMNWCGSGGCNLLILRAGAAGWEQVGNVSRVSNPVRVLTTSTNGLPDIGVTVSGGGGPAPYEAKVSFDGETYPRFPSDEPLTNAEGTVVITDADIPPPAE